MLTLYYAPRSRASRILALIDELGAEGQVEIRQVGILRGDGSGGADAANPHPEGKVPLLVDGGEVIRESAAVATHLCERFPAGGMMPMPGEKGRGAALSWLAWNQGVMEPVIVGHFAGLDHPAMHGTFRGMDEMFAHLAEGLETGPYLLGERYSVADLMCSSVFGWMPALVPDNAAIRAWVERCQSRPSVQKVVARDAELSAA